MLLHWRGAHFLRDELEHHGFCVPRRFLRAYEGELKKYHVISSDFDFIRFNDELSMEYVENEFTGSLVDRGDDVLKYYRSPHLDELSRARSDHGLSGYKSLIDIGGAPELSPSQRLLAVREISRMIGTAKQRELQAYMQRTPPAKLTPASIFSLLVEGLDCRRSKLSALGFPMGDNVAVIAVNNDFELFFGVERGARSLSIGRLPVFIGASLRGRSVFINGNRILRGVDNYLHFDNVVEAHHCVAAYRCFFLTLCRSFT